MKIPFERTFDALYGLTVHDLSEEEATASVPVRDEVKQPMGLVHGGLFASIAESLASNATSFMRPITEGTVHATARRLHRGRTTWVWDVEITDDEGRRCALTRMTIAVR